MVNYLKARATAFPAVRAIHLDIDLETTAATLARHMIRSLLDTTRVGLGAYLLGLVGLGPAERLRAVQERLDDLHIDRQSGVDLHLFNVLVLHESITQRAPTGDLWADVAKALADVVAALAPQVRTVYVLIDEGQYVAHEAAITLLQRMRLVFQRAPYALCLAGTPQLFERLNALEPTFVNLFPETNRFTLAAMEPQHVEELLASRLEPVRVGGRGTDPFDAAAVARLAQEARGNPRYVVRYASAALDLALQQAGSGADLVVRASHVVQAVARVNQVLGEDRFLRLSEAEQAVVQAAYERPDASISELAARLGKSKSTVTREVAQLAARGYLTRRRDGQRVEVSVAPALAAYLGNLER
jgi:DNA-binding MarR family transcriptional regulator/type II secretory pathway predicted ATPase ExeA